MKLLSIGLLTVISVGMALPASAELIIEEVRVQPAVIVDTPMAGHTIIATPISPLATGFVLPDYSYKPGIHVEGRYAGHDSRDIASRIFTIPTIVF